MVKSIRKQLNLEVDIIRVENGAYCPLNKTLSTFLAHIVSLADSNSVVVSLSFNMQELMSCSCLQRLIFSCL